MPVLQGWQWVTLISPVFVTFLLTRVSGVPLLEMLVAEVEKTHSLRFRFRSRVLSLDDGRRAPPP